VYVQISLCSEAVGSELCVRYLPVMITRLMLSLKKATALKGDAWSFGGPTINNTVGFVERRGSVTTRDEIRLDTFESSYGGARSQG